jgi:hypothetical protein
VNEKVKNNKLALRILKTSFLKKGVELNPGPVS